MKYSSDKPIKFGLVGCGRIADRHSQLLGKGQIEGAQLGAVCDLKPERAAEIGQRYNVAYYSDMHEMMQNNEIDVAVVLTESGNHASNAVELARHGKHIIVEKPMALTLADADAMIRACDEAGVRLFVVKQNRFNLPVRKLREALTEGRFGKMVMGTVRVRWARHQYYYDQDPWRGTWAFDGGVLTNQASHHVDLLEWMMGDVESVYAMTRTALVDIEAEDTAAVVLRFASGALGIVEATTATRPTNIEGSISILGSTGTVEIGGMAVNEMKIWKFEDERPEDANVLANYSVNPPNVYGFGHKEYYDHVVAALRSGETQNLVDGLEGRRSLELISAIYESVETGREVPLRFKPKFAKLGQKP